MCVKGRELAEVLWRREALLKAILQLPREELAQFLGIVDRLEAASSTDAALQAAIDPVGPDLAQVACTLAWQSGPGPDLPRLRRWLIYAWGRVRGQLINGEPAEAIL